MPLRLAMLALVPALFAGCLFQNLAPTQQLSETIYALNDEARWSRLDLASERVVPRYRPLFMNSRRAWGREVSIADTEVSAVVLDESGESATSRVEISWYDLGAMELRQTVLRQHWVRTDAGFLLDEESIDAGDETLLELPDEEDEEEDASETAELASR